MRKFISCTILLLFNCIIFAQGQIVGKWLTEDKEGVTEIYEQNGKYFGKIQWLKNPKDSKGVPFTDTENPNGKLKKQPLIGLQILKNLVFKNNIWESGTIYDPQTGKTYSCKIWLLKNNTLKVRGYLGVFYQTQLWTKTN